MLIDYLVQYCDMMYSSFRGTCGCENGHCNHPSGECSGSCYNCLYQIHYLDRAPDNAKKVYDCGKMLFHYVCQYSYLYTSELLCAFEHEWSFLKNFSHYNILSLGCGGCADLMAFDLLRKKRGIVVPISYFGIDINNLWVPIHDKIKEYCANEGLQFQPHYKDVFEFFQQFYVPDTNIIVISYLISYLYNTKQITAINTLVEGLASQVIMKKDTPLLLIINDVNSYKRGRDCFSYFEGAIRRCGLTITKSEYKYFDTGSLFDGQKLGTPYTINVSALTAPRDIQFRYHASTSINATVQLLMEVS